MPFFSVLTRNLPTCFRSLFDSSSDSKIRACSSSFPLALQFSCGDLHAFHSAVLIQGISDVFLSCDCCSCNVKLERIWASAARAALSWPVRPEDSAAPLHWTHCQYHHQILLSDQQEVFPCDQRDYNSSLKLSILVFKWYATIFPVRSTIFLCWLIWCVRKINVASSSNLQWWWQNYYQDCCKCLPFRHPIQYSAALHLH